MKKIVIVLITLAVLVGGSFTGLSAERGKLKIGLAFADVDTEVLAAEYISICKLAEKSGVEMRARIAHDDVRFQIEQIDDLVNEGVDAIIVLAVDGSAIVPAVTRAAARKIPVIAFDRFIPTDKVAAFLTFDQYETGRLQAQGVLKLVNKGRFVLLAGAPQDPAARRIRAGQMEVLSPLVNAGDVAVVADRWVENWDPEGAREIMEGVLAAEGESVIDAVVASNDGTALGALQALEARGLAGKVPISGQDATAAGCNAIARGRLTMSVIKDFRLLAPAAVDLALRLARRQSVTGIKYFLLSELTYDLTLKGYLSCLFLKPVAVDKENLYDVVVKSGYQPYDEVYRDVPEKGRPPRP